MSQSNFNYTPHYDYSELEIFLLLTDRPPEYFEEEKSKEHRKLITQLRANPATKKRQQYIKKFVKKHPNEVKELLLNPFALFFDIDEIPKNPFSGKAWEDYL